MTADEWANLAETMAGVWPAGKLDTDQVETWYGLLADLEGGHVTAALQALAKVSRFQPTIAELRAETARQEVAARPLALPAGENSGPEYMTFLDWRARGYPGCEEWGLTPANCDRITRGATFQELR